MAATGLSTGQPLHLDNLLNSYRIQYHLFETEVHAAAVHQDSNRHDILVQLENSLNEYERSVINVSRNSCFVDVLLPMLPQNQAIFADDEHQLVLDNISRMKQDIELLLEHNHQQSSPVAHSMELLTEFRSRYHGFQLAIAEAVNSNADSTILARLGDDLDEFQRLAIEVSWSRFRDHKLLG